VSKDGAHFTRTLSDGPASEENLKNCGYLLRCWLQVHKVIEINQKVIEKGGDRPKEGHPGAKRLNSLVLEPDATYSIFCNRSRIRNNGTTNHSQ